MNNQYIYNIAEWLVYNSDSVNARCKIIPMNKLEAIKYIVGEEMKYNYEEIALAFEDERVLLILDRYFLKELH